MGINKFYYSDLFLSLFTEALKNSPYSITEYKKENNDDWSRHTLYLIKSDKTKKDLDIKVFLEVSFYIEDVLHQSIISLIDIDKRGNNTYLDSIELLYSTQSNKDYSELIKEIDKVFRLQEEHYFNQLY